MYPFSKSDKKKEEQVLNQSNREEKPIKRNLPEGVWFSGDLQSRPLHCKSSSCHKGDFLWSGLGHEEWLTLTNWSSGFHTFQLKRKDEKDEKVGETKALSALCEDTGVDRGGLECWSSIFSCGDHWKSHWSLRQASQKSDFLSALFGISAMKSH